MTWISLICLLVLTSSAFGQSGYGASYGAAPVQHAPRLLSVIREQPIPRPVLPVVPVQTQGYGQQLPVVNQRTLPIVQQPDISLIQPKHTGGYGQPVVAPTLLPKAAPTAGYGVMPSTMPQWDQQPAAPVPVPTQADIICQGQQPETVIPLETGRKFVVCLDNGKGVEQECPKGLVYHPTSQRCERKLGPLPDPCALQPCLNGGQCVPTDVSSYQCQCAPGFDGKTCELDARVCQTQQPCGQSPDSVCQSFRLGAALQYICILQGGLAYGLNPQQAVPNPCEGIDGPQALTVSKDGFILCDGTTMHVESCPGGTIWDDVEKACAWPDMQTVPQELPQARTLPSFSAPSYGASSYGAPVVPPQQFQQPKALPSFTAPLTIPTASSSYGVPQQPKALPSFDAPLNIPTDTSSYDVPQLPKALPSYGVPQLPKALPSYGVPQQPKALPSYGVPQQPKALPSYGVPQQPKALPSFTAPLDIPTDTSSYGVPQQPKALPSYSAHIPQQKFIQPIAPKQSGYGY